MTTPSGTASYTYDGNGQAATQTQSGTTATFCWNDASTPDLLTDATNTYLYGPDGLPIEQTSAAGTFCFVHDQEGSTLLLLAWNGTVSGAYSYTP